MSYIRLALFALIAFVTAESFLAGGVRAADSGQTDESSKDRFTLDFSGYQGGPVEQWLRSKGFTFEKDAKNRTLLALSITDGSLVLTANRPLIGIMLHEIDVGNVKKIKLNWGIIRYPEDAAYSRQVNNEALMVYVFFGKEKLSSGHLLIPNSPYFIGLYLCQDDLTNFPYKGRYFQAGGRFVCLAKPKPNQMITSEFDLNSAFKSYFQKGQTPAISGIAFGVDTSKAAGGGKAAAVVKSIEFIKDGRD